MKKTFLTILFSITISMTSVQVASAQYVVTCVNCSNIMTQIPQLAKEAISAGANLATQYQTTLATLWETVRTPMENALITLAQQQMANNIITWGNGGFQGNSLIISNPQKYAQSKGQEAVKVGLGSIPQNSIYGDSIFNTIVSNYRNSDPVSQLKSLSQSNIPSIIQDNVCEEETLSSIAEDDVSEDDGTYDVEEYADRKEEIYNSLCVGNPSTDPQLAKKLTEVNKQKPSLGGWDTWLATTGGENDYSRSVQGTIAVEEERRRKEEAAKDDLARGGGVVSDSTCIRRETSDYITGESYENPDEAPCAEYAVVTPSGVVGKSLESAATSQLDRLTNLTTPGGIASLLTNFGISYFAKGLNSTFSTTRTSVTSPGPMPGTVSSSIQDLKNDPDKKTSTIDPIKKQLTSHLNTLNGLETTDKNYLSEISSYSAQLEGIKSCNDSLLTNYPELQGNQTIVSALAFYDSKKSATDSLRDQITRELSLITTLRTLITKTLSEIEASFSTAEILAKFNFYQNQIDVQGLPTITASAAREGEYQMYKFNVGQDTGSDGNITYFRNQCAELTTQMNTRQVRNNNNNGD